MAQVKGISHVAYYVTDLEKAVNFYRDILGFEYAFDIMIPEDIDKILPGHPVAALKGKTSLVYMKAPDGSYIELFRPLPDLDLSSAGPNFEKMGYLHLSLIVDDLNGFEAFLKEKGVTIDSPITKGPDHTYTLWIKDLDGNRIELMEYTSESLQIIHGN